MNLFMTSESFLDSAKALDDARLIKQIAECKTMLQVYLNGATGYAYHPVTKFYADQPWIVARFGWCCCLEYSTRFYKEHKDYAFFTSEELAKKYVNKDYSRSRTFIYAEGKKDDPNCLRVVGTDEVFDLMRKKLTKKWNNYKRPPKWTNRERPSWSVEE